MKYKDLISFEPIETFIQLLDANKEAAAKQLVETYVISEGMADRITGLIFPQLQFDKPLDNKGLLIVGNYGTGKSHLMSFISAIAENKLLLESISNKASITSNETNDNEDKVYAEQIAGRFQVLRAEIGGVETSLRGIVINELETFLKSSGINFYISSN